MNKLSKVVLGGVGLAGVGTAAGVLRLLGGTLVEGLRSAPVASTSVTCTIVNATK